MSAGSTLRTIWTSLLLCIGLLFAPFLWAQQQQSGGIYVIDQERLYQQSEFGKRVGREISVRAEVLTKENKRLEEELKAEELALTEKRPTYEAAEFRELADAFNAKVEKIRSEQATKTQEMNNWAEAERIRFLEALLPVLSEYALELGAIAVFDHRTAILVADRIDITPVMIERIDAAIGGGELQDDQ